MTDDQIAFIARVNDISVNTVKRGLANLIEKGLVQYDDPNETRAQTISRLRNEALPGGFIGGSAGDFKREALEENCG